MADLSGSVPLLLAHLSFWAFAYGLLLHWSSTSGSSHLKMASGAAGRTMLGITAVVLAFLSMVDWRYHLLYLLVSVIWIKGALGVLRNGSQLGAKSTGHQRILQVSFLISEVAYLLFVVPWFS